MAPRMASRDAMTALASNWSLSCRRESTLRSSRSYDCRSSVKVAPPKDLGGTHNSKEGVFNLLGILLPLLLIKDGLTHIAAVVDADYLAQHGLGYQKTIDRITSIVKPFGFCHLEAILASVLDGANPIEHTVPILVSTSYLICVIISS